MVVREPTVAGMFYPEDRASCGRQVAASLRHEPPVDLPAPIRGALVPHAGWTFSGATAGRAFSALAAQGVPETIVLFGAVHSWGVSEASVYGSGSWRTPLGDVRIDEELARAIVDRAGGSIKDRPRAHEREHSIEVQLPFVQHLFPLARILPVAVPPSNEAVAVGAAVAKAVESVGRCAPGIASSDLTHYGPRYGMAPVGTGERALEWTRENDRRLLDLVVQMRAEEVVDEARAHRNACGAGAIAAAIAFSAERGATKGVLLGYTTSHEVMPMGPPTDMVGYASVVFV